MDRKFGTLLDADKVIPADEPVFILRAQDAAAVPAILEYAKAAYEAGASVQHVEDAIASVRRFKAWQEAHGSKTPD